MRSYRQSYDAMLASLGNILFISRRIFDERGNVIMCAGMSTDIETLKYMESAKISLLSDSLKEFDNQVNTKFLDLLMSEVMANLLGASNNFDRAGKNAESNFMKNMHAFLQCAYKRQQDSAADKIAYMLSQLQVYYDSNNNLQPQTIYPLNNIIRFFTVRFKELQKGRGLYLQSSLKTAAGDSEFKLTSEDVSKWELILASNHSRLSDVNEMLTSLIKEAYGVVESNIRVNTLSKK